jgi:carboxyl-terminal processing protease
MSKRISKRKLLVLSALLPLTFALAATSVRVATTHPVALAPTDAQAAASRLVYGVLSDSRYAYRPLPLDDALSADIFRRYLDSLDGGKMFFSQADINRFAPYRTGLDDAIKNQQLQPAYDIFNTYVQRVDERVAYARSLLAKPFDFSAKESWAWDREKAAWASDPAALNELWRKYVKNDVLRLRLAGRPAEEIRTTLDKRYAALAKRAHESRGDDVFESFMNSYAISIDPHTSYMSPRSAETFNMNMRLSLEGIGAVLERQDDFVLIRTLVPGGPAMMSGKLKVGDRVVAVGQGDSGAMTDVVGWRIDDVVDLIRGAKGTKVRLDILPGDAGVDGQHHLLSLVRDKIKLEEQAASRSVIDVQGKKIGVITLPGFYLDFEAARRGDPDARSATSDVAKLLAELKAAKVDGVVMDLRENGGGSLVEAVALTGLFIDHGPVVQVRESGGRVSVDNDENNGVAWDGPLAVLVNRSSASATEIFAAAIQDYGRGLIIGEPTFGKGTVQNLIDLDRWPARDGTRFGQVKLTIAQFFRVSGGTTQHAGVVPDIEFPVTVDASEFGESTFDNALPATRIGLASHEALGNFAPILPRLNAMHQTRSANDREYQWWAQDVAQFHSERDKKLISLNEAERRADRDRLEALRKQRDAQRKALGLAVDAANKDDGLQADERNVAAQVAAELAAKNRPDPLLRESSAILADAITMLSGDPRLAAQVLPATKKALVWAD